MTEVSTSNASYALTLLFAIVLMASMLLKFWLASRQVRHVAAHRDAVPQAFVGRVSLEAHQKAAAYTIAQSRLGMLELAWGGVVSLCWTLLGGLNLLNQWLLTWNSPGLAQQLVLMGSFVVIGAAIDLPFSWYRTFVLEQQFGFNKLTLRLWLQDLLKAGLLSAVIGLPLAALVLWMMGTTGRLWWLWTWGIWMGFNLLMLLIYPTWIAPLFNKFKPLEDATLVARVTALMNRSGFVSKAFTSWMEASAVRTAMPTSRGLAPLNASFFTTPCSRR